MGEWEPARCRGPRTSSPSRCARSRNAFSLLALASLAALAGAGEGADPKDLLSTRPLSLAGELLSDEPGDGSLWVLGGDHYELAPSSVEQRLRVDVLEGGGAVELEIAVRTEGAIRSRIAPEHRAAIELPLTIDPILETFEVTSEDLELLGASDVAYDATTNRFTVVYERKLSAADGDLFSVLYDAAGALLPGSLVAVDITADCWDRARVANTAAPRSSWSPRAARSAAPSSARRPGWNESRSASLTNRSNANPRAAPAST